MCVREVKGVMCDRGVEGGVSTSSLLSPSLEAENICTGIYEFPCVTSDLKKRAPFVQLVFTLEWLVEYVSISYFLYVKHLFCIL